MSQEIKVKKSNIPSFIDETIYDYKSKLLQLLNAPYIKFDKNLHGSLPEKAGIYRISIIGADWDKTVYIGRSIDLRRRISKNHFEGSRRNSTLRRKMIKNGGFENEESVEEYLRELCVVQLLLEEDEKKRSWIEHFAISVLQPAFND